MDRVSWMKPYYDSITLLIGVVSFLCDLQKVAVLSKRIRRHSLEKAFSDRLIYRTVNCPMDIRVNLANLWTGD